MQKLFGTAGYRAKISDVSIATVLVIVKALCELIKRNSCGDTCSGILIGFDTRKFCYSNDSIEKKTSSEEIANKATQIIASSGLKAIKTLKPTPSPVLSWRLWSKSLKNAVAIVNITASHNGFDFIGIKLCNKNGEPESDETYNLLQSIIEDWLDKDGSYTDSNLFLFTDKIMLNPASGDYVSVDDPKNSYVKALKKRINTKRLNNSKMRIAVDYSYGNTIGYLEEIFAETDVTIFPIHDNPHNIETLFNPDTEEEHSGLLKETVIKNKCNFGVVLDTDGNKIGVVDNKGEYINIDYIIALLLEQQLLDLGFSTDEKNAKGSIIVTLPTTRLIEKIAKEFGIKEENIVYTSVGFKHIVKAMNLRPDYILAAEEFGGATISDWIHDSDGLMLLLLLLAFSSTHNIYDSIKKVFIRYNYYSQKQKFQFCDIGAYKRVYDYWKSVKSRIRNKNTEYYFCDKSHSLFIQENDNWMYLRPSGTESVYRVYIEDELALIKKKVDLIIDIDKNMRGI